MTDILFSKFSKIIKKNSNSGYKISYFSGILCFFGLV